MKSVAQGAASGKTRRKKNKQDRKAMFCRRTKTLLCQESLGVKADELTVIECPYTALKLDLKTN